MFSFFLFTTSCAFGYDKHLFALSPLKSKSSQDAKEHLQLLKDVLSVYNQKLNIVAAIIADNCFTNRGLQQMIRSNINVGYIWLQRIFSLKEKRY